MSVPNPTLAKDNYDPRWFIWTIVFLLVSGISLVSWIMLSDTSQADASAITVHHAVTHKK